MKKTKILVLAILAVFTAATSVYAKLPGNTVIIQDSDAAKVNNAYDVNYLFDSSNIGTVNGNLSSSTLDSIYFIDTSQNIKDIFDGSLKKESDLNHKDIEYTSNSYPKGIKYTYSSDNSEYSFSDRPVVKFNVTTNSFNSGYFVSISYNNSFTNTSTSDDSYLSDATYIKINGADKLNITDTDETVKYFVNSKAIPIAILNSGNIVIAYGQIDLSAIKLGQETPVTCALVKPLEEKDLDTPSGNSQNSGEVAFDGTDIYYINSSDRGTLYKYDIPNGTNTEICEDKVKYLCVKGNYVYYSNLSDNGKLYRVNSTSGIREKVADYSVSYITISNDSSVYFIKSSDNKIYSFDGTQLTLSAININNNASNVQVKTINVIGTDIYYTKISDSKLYKYSSSSESAVSSVPNEGLSQFVGSDSSKFISCTANGDVYNGTNKIIINLYNSTTKTSKLDKVAKINVIGGYIYYKSLSDSKLYRVSINGGNAELIVPTPVDNIYVINSKTLYYSQSGKVNRLDISMDSTGKTNFTVTQPQKEVQSKITKVTTDLSGNSLPSTLTVTYADGSTGNIVPVYWDLSKPIYNSSETIYNGVLKGGMTVQYHYGEGSNGFSVSDIVTNNIINNSGNRDTLTISGGGLETGDTVKLYNADYSSSTPTLPQPLGQGVVGADGKVIINNLNIVPTTTVSTTSLWVSRTQKGKKECTTRHQIRGNDTSITGVTKVLNCPVISSVTDSENVYNGADGRDLYIKIANSYISPFSGTNDKKYVYILPKGTLLDLNSTSALKSYDLSDVTLWTSNSDSDYSYYTGTKAIVSDSLGNTLNTGAYDIYLVGEKDGDKYSSDVKSVNINSEQSAASVSCTVIGDKFKAKGALADVNVKLSAKTASSSTISDVTNNYNVSVQRNGLDNEDYVIDHNNVISLRKDYVNTLPVGNNEFTVILTDTAGKTMTSKFVVTVNSAANFQLSPSVSKFTKGYAPSTGIDIAITGTDTSGSTVDASITLSNLTVYVNDAAITNFAIDKNVVKLRQDFLNTLTTGDVVVKIENEDLGLAGSDTLHVVDSQADLIPVIQSFKTFTVNHAEDDTYAINVKLNTTDSTGAATTISSINNIEYEGTKIKNPGTEPSKYYSFNTANQILTIKPEFLNKLQFGDNLVTISGNTSSGSITGNININVKSAARLALNLDTSGGESNLFIKGNSGDLHYNVVKYDDNDIPVGADDVDLTNITLKKGSYTLIKDTDYKVDNTNKIITLKDTYLNRLIPGESTIIVQLSDLTSNIDLTVNE
jgi:Bacterial Ig-like domain (group 4).